MSKIKNEKNIYIKFAIILLISFFAGISTGKLLAFLKENTGNQTACLESLRSLSVYVIPAVFLGMNLIFFLISLGIYLRQKSSAAHWNGENESIIDHIEHALNYPILLSGIAMIANFGFFAVMIFVAEQPGISNKLSDTLTIINIVTLFLSYVWEMAINKLVVDLEKKLNPEKRGNIFDTNFSREWMNSCDEGEKLIIYQSAFTAYKAANTVCLILWVISLITLLGMNTGLLPVIFVCIIWMTLLIAYTVTAIKLEKK